MFVVYSEVTWGYDGGCSTRMHAVCSTEDEAKKLCAELDSTELDQTSEESPVYQYEFVGTPDNMTSMHDTNTRNEAERFDEVMQRNLQAWMFNFQGTKVRELGFQTERWLAVPIEEKIQGFIEFCGTKYYMKQWYDADNAKFTELVSTVAHEIWVKE